MIRAMLYLGVLASAILALSATETTQAAEKRLKCTVGIAARAMIKELYGAKGAELYDITGNLLQGSNPQHQICYRKKTQELIILNSQKMQAIHIHAVAAALTQKSKPRPA